MWNSSDLVFAQDLLDKLRVALSRTEVAPTDLVINSIISAIANDLDTPHAIAALQKWLVATDSGETGGSPGELSRAIDTLLGIAF
jgi:L-cysteine:1D-myo-inositol 2-amino-2-deoxy-alpha-D-glucopyranoside ligase